MIVGGGGGGGGKDVPDLEGVGASVWDEDKVFCKEYESRVRTIRCCEGLKGKIRNQILVWDT